MKKKAFYFFACILAILALTSCRDGLGGTPRDAQELYGRIDRQMNALESYRGDLKMSMTFYTEGYEVKGEGTGYLIEVQDLDGSYYFCQDITTDITSDELSIDTTVSALEAYYDGNYFIFNSEDYKTLQRICAPMTEAEAKEYLEESQQNNFDFVKDCASKDFVKHEDGTWELTCSGYTKVAVEKIVEDLGLDEDTLFAEIMDVQVTILADEKYRATQMKIELVFAGNAKKPSFSYVMDYSQFNEAVAQTDYLAVNKYTKVDSVRILTDLEDFLDEQTKKENGEFILCTEQIVADGRGKELSYYTEESRVTYGVDGDGYFYEIGIVTNQGNYDVAYKNGTQTVEQDGVSNEKRQSEEEARETVDALILCMAYAPSIVTGVTDMGDGVYELSCGNPQRDLYATVFTSSGGRLSSVEQTVTVTVKDGEIVCVSNFVVLEGRFSSYSETVSVTVSQTLDFE